VTVLETALTLVAGSSAGGVGTFIIQWHRDRQADKVKQRATDSQIEGQRDELTLEMIRGARAEMIELRKEIGDQREMAAKAAHIDEALDHIEALTCAETEVEFKAAVKRARAFLKRLRPDPIEAKGERRNDVQTKISAKRIERDADGPD
jgi:molecular chaperone DnaK (HSP70)